MEHPRSIRSYVLRQGRITAAQRAARARLLDAYGVCFSPQPLDFPRLFGRHSPIVLEIGFGMGETTAAIAAANPQIDYLGVEVHSPGVGSLLHSIELRSLTNLRIIQHDAVDVVTSMIPSHALSGIHIFFPDPWPKKRHHKRRLVQPEFIRLLASRLAAGGYLHLATDCLDYAEWMLAVLARIPEIENPSAGFSPRPEYRPTTKFERRGLKLGHSVHDIVVRRIALGEPI